MFGSGNIFSGWTFVGAMMLGAWFIVGMVFLIVELLIKVGLI